MIHVSINPENERAVVVRLERTEKAMGRSITSAIRAATIHLTTVLKRDVLSGQVLNRRTGNLSRAIFHRMESPERGVVGVGKEAPYAIALNDGARPHIIEAKNGKALAFVPGGVANAIRNSAFIGLGRGKGSTVGMTGSVAVTARQVRAAMKANTMFRQRVMHPGNPPFRFMEIGLKMATPEIRSILERAIAATLEKPTQNVNITRADS